MTMFSQYTVEEPDRKGISPMSPYCTMFDVDTIDALKYTPELLLDVSRLGHHTTTHPGFVRACEYGFDGFLEEMLHWDKLAHELVCVDAVGSLAEAIDLVVKMLVIDASKPEYGPFVEHAGFMLGWLSALAFFHREWALIGLETYLSLVIVLAPSGREVAEHATIAGWSADS